MDFSNILELDTINHIKYKNNVVTGVIATDNGNGTYDVYIAGADVAYPNVPTTMSEPDFSIDDTVEILIEYGNKEMPIIIGHAKKIVQEFVEDVINVLVTTLGASSILATSAYFEGRIEDVDGYENCIERGFHYGTTTGYGSEKSSTGSFAAGSYSEQVNGLTANTTYHYQAYAHDADNDVHTGEDKTMTTTKAATYIYCGGSTTKKVWKINPSDMTKVTESIDYGGSIWAVATKNNYVYCGGYSTQKVYKIDISDMSKVAESADYGGRIEAITVLGDYIYCAGSTTTGKIWKIKISDMSKVSELAYGGRVWSLTNDSTYIYAGGDVTNKVWKINPSSMTKIAESDNYGGCIYVVTSNGTNIFCGGYSTQKVWKINPSDMSKTGESIDYNGGIYAITAMGDYVYCTGWNNDEVWQFDIATMTLVNVSDPYTAGIVWALANDGTYVYVGGDTTKKVWQLDPSDMSKVAESANYGGIIMTIAITD